MELPKEKMTVMEDEVWTRINAAQKGYGTGFLSTTGILGFPKLVFRQQSNDRNLNHPHVRNLVGSYVELCRRADEENAIPIGLTSSQCDFSKLEVEHKKGVLPEKLELTEDIEFIAPFGGQHRAAALEIYIGMLEKLQKGAASKLAELEEEKKEEQDVVKKVGLEMSIELARQRVEKFAKEETYGYMWMFVVYDIGE